MGNYFLEIVLISDGNREKSASFIESLQLCLQDVMSIFATQKWTRLLGHSIIKQEY